MSSETGMSRRPVTGKTADVETFQRKFEGSRHHHSRGVKQSIWRKPEKPKSEPGYREKIRAKAQRTGYAARKAVSTMALPTARKVEAMTDGTPKERLTYKVRRGVLTVTNEDGETVRQTHEKGLEAYNGLTLQGETNKKGEMELKRGMGDRRKLAEGNGYQTPREEREIEQNKAFERQVKAKSRRQKNKRRAKKSAEIAKKAGAKLKQVGRSLGRGLGRF